jgi:hypothetical protein
MDAGAGRAVARAAMGAIFLVVVGLVFALGYIAATAPR